MLAARVCALSALCDHMCSLSSLCSFVLRLSSTELPILNSLTQQQPVHSSSAAAAAAASAAAVAAKIRAAASSSSSSARSPHTSPRSGTDDAAQADTPRGAPESELGVLAANSTASASAGPGTSPSKGHWNATITDLTSDVSATLARLDGSLWSSVQKQLSGEFGSIIRLASANSQFVRSQLVKTKTHLREAKLAVTNSAVY